MACGKMLFVRLEVLDLMDQWQALCCRRSEEHHGGDAQAGGAIRRRQRWPAHRPRTRWQLWQSNESLACWTPAPLLLPRVKAALAARRATLNHQQRGREDGRLRRWHSGVCGHVQAVCTEDSHRNRKPQLNEALSANPRVTFSQVAKGPAYSRRAPTRPASRVRFFFFSFSF